MQYVGGKQQSGGAAIAKLVNHIIAARGLETYSEPFCGGLSVTYRIEAKHRQVSDACAALITLYQAMQAGWVPPVELSKEEWAALRETRDPLDPLTAFAGFGCSVYGSWFGTYATRFKRNGSTYVTAALAASESLTRKMKRCSGVQFAACDYRDAPLGEIVYCDPPYDGTMPYKAVAPWVPADFWQWAREQSERRLLAVSELKAPDDFVPVLSLAVQNRIQTGSGSRRQEYLFAHESQAARWHI